MTSTLLLLAPFARALLNDIEENEVLREKPLLGMARRYETKNCKWDRPAHLVLRALVLHAPNPEPMARAFWQALRKGENATILSHCQWHYASVIIDLLTLGLRRRSGKGSFYP